jgi:RNA polymerase sigma-70 factor (sigma-E family)
MVTTVGVPAGRGTLAAWRAQHWEWAERLFSVDAETADVMNGPGRPTRTGSDDADRAVTALFRTHHLELVRLAMVMSGDLATAEDVVQDAFERMHRRWHRLRDPGSGLAYARSTVLNGCRTVHRRSAVARKYMPRIAGPSAPGPDTETALADRGEMLTALRGLPRRQREVLVLRYYSDLDVAEIAATLRISPGTVRSTTSRGLAALAASLGRTQS